jgi:hypothetical protein
MKLKYLCISIVVAVLYIPGVLLAATSYTGFVEQPIWFSTDTFVEGETITIHTAVINGSDKTLAGTVEFFDGQTILGSRVISIPAKSVKQISIDWKVTAGSHLISSRLRDLKIGSDKSGYTAITASDAEAISSKKITVTKKIATGDIDENTDTEESDTASLIDKYVPESVVTFLEDSTGGLESFRTDTAVVIAEKKEKAKEDVHIIQEELKNAEPTESTTENTQQALQIPKDSSSQDMLKKPLAFVSLFFYTLLDFIFKTKLLFYGILAFAGFAIVRYLFRLLRRDKES